MCLLVCFDRQGPDLVSDPVAAQSEGCVSQCKHSHATPATTTYNTQSFERRRLCVRVHNPCAFTCMRIRVGDQEHARESVNSLSAVHWAPWADIIVFLKHARTLRHKHREPHPLDSAMYKPCAAMSSITAHLADCRLQSPQTIIHVTLPLPHMMLAIINTRGHFNIEWK